MAKNVINFWVSDQRLFVVIYTTRGSNIRIISARKANQREVYRYEKSKREY
jgi:uncharacterized DUF497 family protein